MKKIDMKKLEIYKNMFVNKGLLLLGALTLSFGMAFSNVYEPYCALNRPADDGFGCKDRLSIEEVVIEQNGTIIYHKNADGCSGPHDINLMSNAAQYGKVSNTENNPIILSAGATYRLGINSSGNTNSDNGYASAWIDYNQNYNFVDADEWLNSTSTSWPVSSPAGTTGSMSYIQFTIDCSVKAGLTRLRISLARSSSAATLAKGCVLVPNIPSRYPDYGETEDFYINIVKSTKLAADFIIPDKVYVNSPVKFVNKNNVGYISHDWNQNGAGFLYSGIDFETEFSAPGNYSIELRSVNCFGTTNETKSVNVTTPSSTPVIEFIGNATTINQGDELILYDLSGEGPTSWDWQLNNPLQPAFDLTNANGVSAGYAGRYNRIIFQMNNVGKYDVCLTAGNTLGASSKCKTGYITVTTPNEILLGIGDDRTDLDNANIYDRGGFAGDYSTGELGKPENNKLLIKPCNADIITLTISQLKFADAKHGLRVWDGESSGGIALHPSGGFTAKNSSLPFSIEAKSGAMYIELNTSAGSETDSGIVARYESTLKPAPTMKPSFDFYIDGQNQAYKSAVTIFESTSENISGIPSYGWYVDGVAVPTMNLSDGGRVLNYEFASTGTYEVCLLINSCAGDTMVCKNINVINPNKTAILEIEADQIRPQVGDVVSLSSLSDIANKFRWEIVPLGYTLEAPYTLGDKDIKIRFTEAGSYNIRLTGWNSSDSANTVRSTVKDSFIRVVDYCEVGSNIVSSDIGNNRLIVKNAQNTTIFDQESTTGADAYQNFTSDEFEIINFFAGASYSITMSRNTNFDNVTRAIYVDFDGDGIFTSDEMVGISSNNPDKNVTLNFKIPTINSLIEGFVRMRVITTAPGISFNPCSSLSVGEIEDYKVQLNSSKQKSEITLIGDGIMYADLGGTFTDPGATAYDPVEGDVTDKIVATTNIDLNNVGMYYVRYNLTNASNVQANQKERLVIVMADNVPPVMTMLGNNPDYLEAGNGAYVDLGVTANDNVQGDVTDFVIVSGGVDHTTLGTYYITYSVYDNSGNNTTMVREVEVGDKTAPEIQIQGESNINLGSIWTDLTFATDNYWTGDDVVLTKTYGFNGPVNPHVKGTYDVTYTAVDGSGNESNATRIYTVGDFEAPVIYLNTDAVVIHDVNTPYISVKPTYMDNMTPTNELSTFKFGSVNAYALGDYTETFQAIDKAGNIAEATRTVKVVDRIAPTIAVPYICTPLYNVYNNKHGVIVSDNYYSSEELMDYVDVIYSDVNIFFEGIYKNLYVVTDPSGNRSEEVWRTVEVNKKCAVISSVNSVDSDKLISVYPNPTNGKFEINLGEVSRLVNEVTIVNALGENILNLNANQINEVTSIDLTNYASGVYTVKITGEDLNIVKRIVLVK